MRKFNLFEKLQSKHNKFYECDNCANIFSQDKRKSVICSMCGNFMLLSERYQIDWHESTDTLMLEDILPNDSTLYDENRKRIICVKNNTTVGSDVKC